MTRRSKYKPTVQGREIKGGDTVQGREVKVGDVLYDGERRKILPLKVFEIHKMFRQFYAIDEHQDVYCLQPYRGNLFWTEAEAVECSTKYTALHNAAGALHDAYTCVCSLSHHSITVDTATKIRNLTEELSKTIEQARKEIKQCP